MDSVNSLGMNSRFESHDLIVRAEYEHGQPSRLEEWYWDLGSRLYLVRPYWFQHVCLRGARDMLVFVYYKIRSSLGGRGDRGVYIDEHLHTRV